MQKNNKNHAKIIIISNCVVKIHLAAGTGGFAGTAGFVVELLQYL